MEIKKSTPKDEFLNPKEIIKQLEIKKGAQVADFGCASGYFTIPFAEAIGENGKLFALDILPYALETVNGKARAGGITNIETKRTNLEKKDGSGLSKNSMDWVLLKDILFQNKNKEIILREAHSVLKSGGKIVVVEWSKDNIAIGPEVGLRIAEDDLKKLIESCGFIIEKELPAGDFHYSFVAVK